MSTITEPHQAPAVRPLPLRLPRAATAVAVDTVCQLCATTGAEPLLDLGLAPLSAAVGASDAVDDPTRHPLRLVRCIRCSTLQLADGLDADARYTIGTAVGDRSFAGRPDLARRFCEDAIDRWGLRGDGHVIEIGSGTGSLLRFFRAWQLPVLGIELDQQLSRYARLRRVPTWRAEFDGAIAGRLAAAGMHADLVVISTPTGAFADLRTLLTDVAGILRPRGVVTLEVPDILRIVGRTRFDEVAHAHRVVPTTAQLQAALPGIGLDLVDVERAEVAGARLRLWIQRSQPEHDGSGPRENARMHTRLRAEAAAAIDTPAAAAAFARRAELVRDQITALLDDARAQHCAVAGEGAGPSAVALANMVGLSRRDVAYVVDPDPVRSGTLLPGTDIPVVATDEVGAWRPDLVLALGEASATPPAWDGVPLYTVADLIDVVHRLTGAADAT